MARLHRRYRKRKKNPSEPRSARPNPPPVSELIEWGVPGFGAFAASRFGTRVATTQIAKWKPSMGKHAGAVAAVGAFLAAWFLANRLKWLAKYHTPIAVGAAIAMAQSLLQIYIPKLGWLVSDASSELPAGTAAPAAALPEDLEYTDEDPDGVYQYNDAFDPGRHATSTPPPAAQAPAAPSASQTASDTELDLDLELDNEGGMGIFAAAEG